MKKLLLGIALAAFACEAVAQPSPGPGPNNGIGQAPYIYTSTGFVAVAAFTTSTGFSAPAGSTICYIQAQGQPVNFRTDNVAPTAAIGPGSTPGGVPLPVGASLALRVTNFGNFKAIPQAGTSTMTADCYR